MELRGTKLGQILVSLGVVDEEQVDAALGVQKNWGHPLGQAFVAMGILDEATVVRALSLQLGTPSVHLAGLQVPSRILDLIPFDLAVQRRALPLDIVVANGGEALVVAMTRPWDIESVATLEFVTGMRLICVVAGDEDLAEAIGRHHTLAA